MAITVPQLPVYFEHPELAGGFLVGDRVSCGGRMGTVWGRPARPAVARLSVAVRFDDGRITDERASNLTLESQAEADNGPVDREKLREFPAPPPPASGGPAAGPRSVAPERWTMESQAAAPRPVMRPRQQEQQEAVTLSSREAWGMPRVSGNLAGGFSAGDVVINRQGDIGVIMGPPARASCASISVAVKYERNRGRVCDERIGNLTLKGEEPIASAYLMEEVAPEVALENKLLGRNAPEQSVQPAWQDEVPSQPGSPDSPTSMQDYGQAVNGTTTQRVDEAEAALRDKILYNFPDLRSAFRKLDQSNNGFVTREDFFQAMANVLLANGFSEDDIYGVADKLDLNKDGYITFPEFVTLAECEDHEPDDEGADYVDEEEERQRLENVDLAIQKFKQVVDQRYPSLREAFRAMDRDRRSALTPMEFMAGMRSFGINLLPDEMEEVFNYFDVSGAGFITYPEFAQAMSQRPQFGKHLGRQMFKSEMY